MADTVPNAALRTHANSLRTERLDGLTAKGATVRMAANSSKKSKESRKRVREAMRSVGLSQKAYAVNCGQPESVISEALAGNRALDIEWNDAQGPLFRDALRKLEDADAGADSPLALRQASFEAFMALARQFWFGQERQEKREAVNG